MLELIFGSANQCIKSGWIPFDRRVREGEEKKTKPSACFKNYTASIKEASKDESLASFFKRLHNCLFNFDLLGVSVLVRLCCKLKHSSHAEQFQSFSMMIHISVRQQFCPAQLKSNNVHPDHSNAMQCNADRVLADCDGLGWAGSFTIDTHNHPISMRVLAVPTHIWPWCLTMPNA